jgi:hypothetical protein
MIRSVPKKFVIATMLASVMVVPVVAIAQSISCWKTPLKGTKGIGCLLQLVDCTPSSGGAWDEEVCKDPNGTNGGPTLCVYNFTEKYVCTTAFTGSSGCKPIEKPLTQECWQVLSGQAGCSGDRNNSTNWSYLGKTTIGQVPRAEARTCRLKGKCYIPK